MMMYVPRLLHIRVLYLRYPLLSQEMTVNLQTLKLEKNVTNGLDTVITPELHSRSINALAFLRGPRKGGPGVPLSFFCTKWLFTNSTPENVLDLPLCVCYN